MSSNIVTAAFGASRSARTRALHQWDYGQILKFVGLNLPSVYTVHFSNTGVGGEAKTMIGNADGVDIPDEYLTTGQSVYAWVYLHTGADDGETVYSVIIPVKARPRPCEDVPTPVQQGAIEQAIAALNTGVAAAQEAAQDAEQIATDLGDFDSAMRAVTADKEEAAGSAANASTAAGEAADSAAEAAEILENMRTEGAAQISAIDAKGREVRESIPLDYSELSADVVDLKSHTPSVVDTEETEADLYLTDSQGNVLAEFADGHIKTKNFDSENVGTDLIMNDNSDADADITDSFGNVLVRLKNGHIKTKRFDSEDLPDFDALDDDISDLQADVSDLQAATSGILYRNKEVLDGIYAACRWHQPHSTDKQFCLLLAGDIHGDTVRMQNMIEFMNAVDAFDGGIMLGDIMSWYQDATWYTEAISNATKPFLTLVGNHDAASYSDDPDKHYEYVHDFYLKFYEPNLPYADLQDGEHESDNTYYYKDFVDQKIRIISLNQYEYPPDKNQDGTYVYQRGAVCYSQSQIDWLVNVLADTPSDYGVIIAFHVHPGWMEKDMDNILTASTAAGTAGAPSTLIASTNGYIIEEIVNAWVNGTTLNTTFAYTVSGTYGTGIAVNADFTSRGEGEFITYISGHWHMSIVSKTHNHGQASYTVAAAGLNAETQSDQPRRAGTRSEDHFVAMAVDRDLKTVKIIQIGAHFSKDGKDRLYGQYSYAIE